MGGCIKTFHGPNAQERFDQRSARPAASGGARVRFVPRLLEADPENLRIVTTNCGTRVEHLMTKRGRGTLRRTGAVRRAPRRPGHAQRHLPPFGRALLPDRFRVRHHSARHPSSEAKCNRDSASASRKAASLQWSGCTGPRQGAQEQRGLVSRPAVSTRGRFIISGKFGEASLENMDFAFAVSDGMGGAKAGEFASRIAVEKITTLLPRSFKHSALGLQAGFRGRADGTLRANPSSADLSRRQLRGMRTAWERR